MVVIGVLVVAIGFITYSIYDGTIELREVTIPTILSLVIGVIGYLVTKGPVPGIICFALLGIYLVLKLFGGDVFIR